MRIVLFGAVGASLFALGACAPTVHYEGYDVASPAGTPLHTLAALDCPAVAGALTRTAQAADGQSCDYRGPGGEAVRLKLVALGGRKATEAMAPIRAELQTLVPLRITPVPPIARDAVGERTDIDLPFFHVHTVGEHADVKIFGIKVQSEGEHADVKINSGGKHTIVHAGPGGAEVLAEDVNKTNASLVYVLTTDKGAPSGYSAVGYVAKGPVSGPLVVGEFRATQKSHHGEYRSGDHNDIGRLIDRNTRS
jgi:hypothetical protein